VLRFARGRLVVSVGTPAGSFGWCDPDCRRVHHVATLDDLEIAVRGSLELSPSTETTLDGEAARSFGWIEPSPRRYVIALHGGRPVAVMIDVGDQDVAEGVIDEMIEGFRFVDPPPPPPPDQVFTEAGGRVELGLSSGWQRSIESGSLSRANGREVLTVAVGTADGTIKTCKHGAGPWELCRTVKVRSLADLAAAVEPAPIADHGIGPPNARSEENILDGETSIVVRIQGYEYPARGGQEVVYVGAFHRGRPFLLRVWTSNDQVADLDTIIAGFKFKD
jgi:hypothetical protein